MAKVLKNGTLEYDGKKLAVKADCGVNKRAWTRGAVFKLASKSFELRFQMPNSNVQTWTNTPFTVGLIARNLGFKDMFDRGNLESQRWELKFNSSEGGWYANGGLMEKTIVASGLNLLLISNPSTALLPGTGSNAFKYGDEVVMMYSDGKLTLGIDGRTPFSVKWPKGVQRIDAALEYYPYINLGANAYMVVHATGLDAQTEPTVAKPRRCEPEPKKTKSKLRVMRKPASEPKPKVMKKPASKPKQKRAGSNR